MWVAKANKKLLLDLIQSQDPFKTLRIEDNINIKSIDLLKEELLFVWGNIPDKGIFLPELIYVPQGQLRDFLAWASTYIVFFRPFTSFCRVIEWPQKIDNNNINNNSIIGFESSLIGIILGECLTHYINKDIRKINPLAIKSTYSFAIGKGFSLNTFYSTTNYLEERLLKMRYLINYPKQVLRVMDIKQIWSVFSSLINNKNTQTTLFNIDSLNGILNACNNINEYGQISPETWSYLSNNYLKLNDFNIKMKDTIEERVIWSEKCISTLNDSNLDKRVISFLSAYIISQIAPGSIKYVNLLSPSLEKYPDIILWYGLCAGLYPNSEVLYYNDGFGWRILRDIIETDNFYHRPNCDISLDELEVLIDVDKPNKGFFSEYQSYFTIEIAPMINVLVINPNSSIENNSGQTINKNEKNEELLNQIGSSLSQTMILYKKYYDTVNKDDSYRNTKYKSKNNKIK